MEIQPYKIGNNDLGASKGHVMVLWSVDSPHKSKGKITQNKRNKRRNCGRNRNSERKWEGWGREMREKQWENPATVGKWKDGYHN